jgi:hypothetical protein
MFRLLRQICALIAGSLSPEPTMRFDGKSSRDGLPPVFDPANWSHGMLERLADSETVWYFDRR